MNIDVAVLRVAVGKARDAFAAAEAELNAADARLGDGDTGTMLKRLTAAVAVADLQATATPADAFRRMAMRASSSTGSSLGTLVMTALMSLSKSAADKPVLETTDLAPMLDIAIAAMEKRGGAKPGDKTVLDSLIAVSAALRDGSSPAAAARAALDRFRAEPNSIGRAGRYGEQSRGLDDPGMLAVSRLCDALA